MPMLGDLLAAARDSAGTFQAWLAASDPELAARVTEAAVREGDSPAAFVRAAVFDFNRFASEEEWATLTSRLRDGSDDPGIVCLVAMVEWRHEPLEAHTRHRLELDEETRS
ncbi:MAG: hypothetical protein ACXW3X_10445 [Rhodoplanes sp.]